MAVTITDMFCGSGGSSTGAVWAGAEIKYALNHWARAIETHNTNHPQAIHACVDLHMEDPRRYSATTGLIASPECTNHSLAKGAQRRVRQAQSLWASEEDAREEEELQKQERSRCLMYTPLDWAERHKYQFVIIENVVDAYKWGPDDNGALFQAWLGMWRALGYETRCIFLNSMFVGAPQSRDRLYVVAWRKGLRTPNLDIRPDAYCTQCAQAVGAVQSWKNRKKQHGKYNIQYIYRCPHCAQKVNPSYQPAATIIDWNLPIQRIGDRKRQLKQTTLKRIQDGINTYMRSPMLLQMSHGGRIRPISEVLPTQTKYDDTALVTPPFMMDHLGEYRPRPLDRAMSTICAGGNHHSVITPPHWARVLSYYKNGSMVDPIVRSLSTVTTVERHGLLTSDSTNIHLPDCSFRMLATKEIQAAMAFPDDYVLTGTRAEQVHQLGDGVTPPVMQLLIERIMEVL